MSTAQELLASYELENRKGSGLKSFTILNGSLGKPMAFSHEDTKRNEELQKENEELSAQGKDPKPLKKQRFSGSENRLDTSLSNCLFSLSADFGVRSWERMTGRRGVYSGESPSIGMIVVKSE